MDEETGQKKRQLFFFDSEGVLVMDGDPKSFDRDGCETFLLPPACRGARDVGAASCQVAEMWPSMFGTRTCTKCQVTASPFFGFHPATLKNSLVKHCESHAEEIIADR